MLCLAIILDILDGRAARLLRATSEVGRQLDSFCDGVSFGAAPGAVWSTSRSCTSSGSVRRGGRPDRLPARPVCIRLSRFNHALRCPHLKAPQDHGPSHSHRRQLPDGGGAAPRPAAARSPSVAVVLVMVVGHGVAFPFPGDEGARSWSPSCCMVGMLNYHRLRRPGPTGSLPLPGGTSGTCSLWWPPRAEDRRLSLEPIGRADLIAHRTRA